MKLTIVNILFIYTFPKSKNNENEFDFTDTSTKSSFYGFWGYVTSPLAKLKTYTTNLSVLALFPVGFHLKSICCSA